MSGVQTVTVTRADAGQRLDRWFRQHYPQLGQAQLQKLLRKGQVRVDGGRAKADRRLEAGEVVRVPPLSLPEERPAAPRPEGDPDAIRRMVIHEDERLLVLNKPSGLAVQGGARTLRHIDGMLEGWGKGDRPRLVHRLDRDTSGVMVLAKDRATAAALGDAFKHHRMVKTYWALCRGVPHPLQGRINVAMEKTGEDGKEKVKTGHGKRAITDYQVVETAGQKASFIALRPETGRTHQIRVHLSMLNTPIVGDRKYGGEHSILEGVSQTMHLHCREMQVPLPNGRLQTFRAPLQDHMLATWKFFSFGPADDLEWPDAR